MTKRKAKQTTSDVIEEFSAEAPQHRPFVVREDFSIPEMGKDSKGNPAPAPSINPWPAPAATFTLTDEETKEAHEKHGSGWWAKALLEKHPETKALFLGTVSEDQLKAGIGREDLDAVAAEILASTLPATNASREAIAHLYPEIALEYHQQAKDEANTAFTEDLDRVWRRIIAMMIVRDGTLVCGARVGTPDAELRAGLMSAYCSDDSPTPGEIGDFRPFAAFRLTHLGAPDLWAVLWPELGEMEQVIQIVTLRENGEFLQSLDIVQRGREAHRALMRSCADCHGGSPHPVTLTMGGLQAARDFERAQDLQRKADNPKLID